VHFEEKMPQDARLYWGFVINSNFNWLIMNVDYSFEEQAFRAAVKTFLEQKLPNDIRHKVLNGKRLVRDDFMRWQRILFDHGWGGPYWPKEYGGTGWNQTEVFLFEQECVEAGAPGLIAFGQKMLAPVLMAFGSPAQKENYLPRILRGEDFWCQGYSEPGSGSDLASLKTKAERMGNKYIVNGQKIWTTQAQFADWIFCLVRTASEGRPQQGISFLLIDMKSPGVSVRPIIMLDGEHEVNEVFFDNVEVPTANLVGEENKGWTCAKFLLSHERTGLNLVALSKLLMRRLQHIARAELSNGKPLMDDVRFRDRFAQCEMELMAHEMTLLRTLAAMAKSGSPGPEASILKIRGSEIAQAIFELTMYAVGPEALAYLPAALDADWDGAPIGADYTPMVAGDYFNMRKLTIFGGSNEIQRNIVAQHVLGL
jgi:alkylation response protein AidB-like acyl-CoA dehydrogenase